MWWNYLDIKVVRAWWSPDMALSTYQSPRKPAKCNIHFTALRTLRTLRTLPRSQPIEAVRRMTDFMDLHCGHIRTRIWTTHQIFIALARLVKGIFHWSSKNLRKRYHSRIILIRRQDHSRPVPTSKIFSHTQKKSEIIFLESQYLNRIRRQPKFQCRLILNEPTCPQRWSLKLFITSRL